MPFDLTSNTPVVVVPEALDFKVHFHTTSWAEKKYVINSDTGEYIGIVGKDFKCASHGDFFRQVVSTATEEYSSEDMEGAQYKFSSARSGAWAMLDIRLPNMVVTIDTDKHSTEIGNRIVALHGVDGSCSNTVFFGEIDFFCTNGMVRGDYSKIKKKNTSGFSLDTFISELANSRVDFYQEAGRLQSWAKTSLKDVDMSTVIGNMIPSERKAERMLELYYNEALTRGENKWALYSALTNYASYADDRNGFALRNTGKDTQAQSMWGREQEVAKWVSSNTFKQLQAA